MITSARKLYLFLTFTGAILPLAAFAPWLAQHGLDIPLMLNELFVNRVSSFFAIDVLLSACTVFAFVLVERSRHKNFTWWLPVVATLLFGVSAGLPAALYSAEQSRRAMANRSESHLR